MKNIRYIAGVIMLLIPALAGAQALPFTAAETDAASLGTAGANIVETGSVANAAFYNAAAIPFSDSSLDVAAGYTMWTPSKCNIINAAGAYNLNDKFGFALGFSYGMNPSYDISSGSGSVIGSFKPSDMQLNAGFSYRFLPYLSAGVNVGYASSEIAKGHSYDAVAADVFVMGKFSDFKVALGVSNLGSSVAAASGANFSLPAAVTLGAGYSKVFSQKHGINVLVDADYYLKEGVAVAAGAGYAFDDMVFVRAGYRYGGNSAVPSYASVGVGVKFFGVKLDAAYLIAAGAMKNTLAVGLGYSF